MDLIGNGDQVMVLWAGSSPPSDVQTVVEDLQTKVQTAGKVQLEHCSRLSASGHNGCSFTQVMSGFLGAHSVDHNDTILAEIVRILKPNGKLLLKASADNGQAVTSKLRLAGFINVTEPVIIDDTTIQISASKPAYEVGSTARLLSFGNKTNAKVDDSVANVWSLSANDMLDDGVEIMDSDDLLNEDDLKKPDPSTLRDCGPGKKKKACKNCTCGLAEEMNGESASNDDSQQKSACGNCYLGDAFRCASCPYLGMPAFKPGEKIQLSKKQLNADS